MQNYTTSIIAEPYTNKADKKRIKRQLRLEHQGARIYTVDGYVNCEYNVSMDRSVYSIL